MSELNFQVLVLAFFIRISTCHVGRLTLIQSVIFLLSKSRLRQLHARALSWCASIMAKCILNALALLVQEIEALSFNLLLTATLVNSFRRLDRERHLRDLA